VQEGHGVGELPDLLDHLVGRLHLADQPRGHPPREPEAALDLIIELDPEVVVPGHGPVSDVNSALMLRRYFNELTAEVRRRFDAGQGVAEAATEITLEGFENWGESERLAASVEQLYREFRDEPPAPALELVVAMARRALSSPS